MSEPSDDHLTRAQTELGDPEELFRVSRGRFLAKLAVGLSLVLFGVVANYLWWVHGPGRFGHVELLQRLNRGESVDPKLVYFRTVPKFETGSEKYRWLMENLFIGSAARLTDRVVIDVHQVL